MMDIIYLIPFLVLMFPSNQKLMIPILIINGVALFIYYRFLKVCSKQICTASQDSKDFSGQSLDEVEADSEKAAAYSEKTRADLFDKSRKELRVRGRRDSDSDCQDGLSVKTGTRILLILLGIVIDALACYRFYIQWMKVIVKYGGELPEDSRIPLLFAVLSFLLGCLAFYGIYRLILLIYKREADFVSWIGCGPLSFLLSAGTLLIYGTAKIYTAIDNWMLSVVLNGIYDPADRTSMFVSPVLSWICGFLSRFLPQADTFMLTMEIVLFFSIWFWLYCALRNRVSLKAVLVFLLALWISGNMTKIFFQSFTLTSGFAVACGLYGMISAVKNHRIWMIFPSGVLIFFGFAIRLESALLPIPFGVLAFLMTFFQGGFSFKKEYAKAMIPALVLTLAAAAIPTYSYFQHNYSPEMNSARIYNDSRSNIWDFPHVSPEEADLSQTDLSLTDVKMVENKMLADTDFFTSERLTQIDGLLKREDKPVTKNRIKNALLATRYLIDERPYMQIQIGIYLAVMLYCLIGYRKGWIRFAGLVLAGTGSLLIFVYFGLVGRLIPRIVQPVFYGVWICIMTALSSSEKQRNPMLGLIALPALLWLCLSWESTYNKLPFDSNTNLLSAVTARDSAGEGEIKDQKKRLWHLYNYNEYALSTLSDHSKLPSEEFFNYNVTDADWIYGQPYFKAYLERLGVPNPMASLASGEMTYVAPEEQAELVAKFLRERYDPGFVKVSMEEYAGYPQWKFDIENRAPAGSDSGQTENEAAGSNAQQEPSA